ncbi:hypothetical protein NDU88_001294 [Pleurodeles waltl]|uniref:Integrase catalytic domain-containing protein n=1 Tax=Pleurodeles waltl TaxID=8319 RepID=A0AAV7P3Q2_PLEWA|nr:hypothetical protein NDU88_001294 [Pleurodeles waltl]
MDPPFSSREWAEFLKSRNTRHRRITTRWPQANDEVEQFVKTPTKVIRITIAEAQNVESSIYAFLREYRVTPHATTGLGRTVVLARVYGPAHLTPLGGDVPLIYPTGAGHMRDPECDMG